MMDASWQQLLVVGAALLFIGFLLWKYKPKLPSGKSRRTSKTAREAHPKTGSAKPRQIDGATALTEHDAAKLAVAIKVAREQARTATTPRVRAEALSAAARAAARSPEHVTSAIGLYLRAMRADPSCPDPVRGIAALLRDDRPELLETVLWRRLSHLSWTGDTADAAKCAAEELVELYRGELRNRDRAKVMQRLAGRM
jgi:hypothetical protein